MSTRGAMITESSSRPHADATRNRPASAWNDAEQEAGEVAGDVVDVRRLDRLLLELLAERVGGPRNDQRGRHAELVRNGQVLGDVLEHRRAGRLDHVALQEGLV